MVEQTPEQSPVALSMVVDEDEVLIYNSLFHISIDPEIGETGYALYHPKLDKYLPGKHNFGESPYLAFKEIYEHLIKEKENAPAG